MTRRDGLSEHIRQRRRRLLTASAVVVAAALLGGCGTVIRLGRMPDTEALETTLTPGVSTRLLVQDTLGEPYGTGGVMLPGQDHPRDLWCYYAEEGTLTDDRRTFLFVFLDGDIYDGYMLFSSLPNAP